ncbi:MAG: TolC family protein [Mariprofundaceae bacterium]|nr:TolC family protein [Mariprofundaceae bacterium]
MIKSIVDIVNINTYVSLLRSKLGLLGYPQLSPVREGVIQNMRFVFIFLSCSTILFAAASARAEPVGLDTVIRNVLERHPDVSLSRLQPQFADADAQGIAGQLDPALSATVSVSDEQTPFVSQFAPVSAKRRQFIGTISKPLASGDTVTLNMDYNRRKLDFNSPFAAQLANPNPAYRSQINLSVRHPLLRGAGRPAYNKALEASHADKEAALMQVRTTEEQLALQALQLYYGIASDTENVKLADEAVSRAKRVLADQRRRERLGLVEVADRLQAGALLATRRMNSRQARATLARDIAALNRLMLRDPDTPLSVLTKEPVPSDTPDFEEAIRRAQIYRPEIKNLEAKLQAAESRLTEARDKERMQLDVVAKLGSRALNGLSGTAFKQGFSISDRFASLDLEFSDTLGRRSARSGIRRAALDREQVLLEHRQALERIKDDISRTLTTFTTERRTWHAAKIRVKAEKLMFEAERRRYREGRSSTANLIQFEGELLTAEVDASRSHILLLLAYRQMQWAEGLLLQTLHIVPVTSNKTQQ